MSRKLEENFHSSNGATIQLQHCFFFHPDPSADVLDERFIFVLFHCIREQTLQQHDVTYHFFSHRPLHYYLSVRVVHTT